jgi:hypothetical protein
VSRRLGVKENLVRLSDYRDRPARVRRSGSRGRRFRPTGPADEPSGEPMTATVQAVAPDVVAVAIPTVLWPALSDWLREQGVRVSGEL